MIGGGQHGAIPHEPGCPKAIWGQLRRKKFRASEDLFTQNPEPPERNTRPDFYVSCAGDGPMFRGALGLDGHTGYHSGGLGRQEGESGSI